MLLKIRHALLEVNNSTTPTNPSLESFYCCSKQSAIIINNEFVFTAANVLQEFLNTELDKNSSNEANGMEFIRFLQKFQMIPLYNKISGNEHQSIVLDELQKALENLQYLITFDYAHNRHNHCYDQNDQLLATANQSNHEQRLFMRKEAKFLGLFYSPKVYNQLLQLACQNNDVFNHCRVILSSTFLILTLKSKSEEEIQKKNITEILLHIRNYLNNLQPIRCMDDILVMSSPFGLESFYKTINIGKISNILDEHGSVFMISNPLSIGCEGSAVFNHKLRLIGIVICTTFPRYQDNMIQLTLVASLNHLLQEFLQYFGVKMYSTNILKTIPESTFNWENSVVLIDSSGNQGSGTLIKVQEKRYILTCAHVVFQASGKIRCWSRNRKFEADVIWHNSHYDTAFDVALLQVNSSAHQIPDSHFKRLETRFCVVGQRIYNAGFPHFSHSRETAIDLRPAIFEGRIIKCNPWLLVSDGAVQSGQSGGPMFDENGVLVGISVSNIKWKTNIYPNLNSAVPVAAIATVLHKYSKSGDINVLQALIAPEFVQRMWSLKRPPVTTVSKL